MEIKVVGSGCRNCKNLLENVKKAVGELGIQATVIYVTDIRDIMATGIMQTPGLIVNGKTRTTGRVPGEKEIKEILQAE
ncbi:MAG: thioredoxin family protein [Clostridia bacterium]